MNLPVVYHSDYVTPLPEQHRFPMPKFKLLYELLLKDQIITQESTYKPTIANDKLLQLVHNETYVSQFCDGTLDDKSKRRIGLPWSEGLVKRTCTAVGGTILTVQLALEHGICCNLAGGTHHAFPDYGSGFCIFNDIAIASRYLLIEKIVNKILIIDLDVHQGDGTAFIFRDDERVFTFSMHCEANFPYRKQKSDLDIPLPIGLDDDGYLQILAFHLTDLLKQVKPDIVIYDAGVDVSGCDRLGKLSLTDTGIYRREMMVLSTCLAEGYPVAGVIGGGYCKDLDELVYRHSLIHRAAAECI
ncbi:histone deacetylase [Cyanobacterium aponinum UTEX 3222]|uniref:Histone deacetylase n=1 Tax=Cyanobacterium aponinum (strain PCC 10605) TaxID=755178 RepID=K9Z512_CYAAP|nr:histone deacetylase [Cyanobacterium aponinum]AFZ54214.1 Histone deacetylase [Cyanobacterium aponinum PCC 10605]PHV61922.1 histone deacetylase [Cyanobacterium aponinum IPPAS B-1201]WRL37468.1 histone deacetylase [Cyanobacterium aponinum UTEX 3221]WRL43827.1 histone deacetylase [Cyanobacterium aponinum UTEX 3222]